MMERLTVMDWRLRLSGQAWRISDIYGSDFLNIQTLYLYRFRKIPAMAWIGGISVDECLGYLRNNYADRIVDNYQSSVYGKESGELETGISYVVLAGKTIIELSYGVVQIAYDLDNAIEINALAKVLGSFREKTKAEVFEINIITRRNDGLVLKPLTINPMLLDVGLYYNDDFAEVDKVISERLAAKNDKGIVLLHGLPGTGKTTYLRSLVGSLAKRVLFVSPSVAANLSNPEFIDLLLDYPNSILVIEDAENIMRDRKLDSGSSVSNLLNLSDGLLSDCVSVQIICTFNSSLDQVDSALMRKGRLIARYDFGKLSVEKARKLSASLGFKSTIDTPMSLAEITNQDKESFENKKVEVIGFRRHEVEMN